MFSVLGVGSVPYLCLEVPIFCRVYFVFITTLQQFYGKSATNGLHFFVRYDNMYCSDAQMSLLKKQMEREQMTDGRDSILLCCEKKSFA
jgi:hypothetical protein